MKRDELIKSLLKSIKSGRLHKLVKLILIVSFVYLSFLVSLSLKDYFLQEFQITKLEKSGFNLKLSDGVLKIKADRFYLQKQNLQLELQKPEVEIDIVKSIKELRIHLTNFQANSIWLLRKPEKAKRENSFPTLPISVDKAKVGKFHFEEGNTRIDARNLRLDNSSIFLGGAILQTGKHSVRLPALQGTVQKEWIEIPNFWLVFDENEISGRLRFTRNLKNLQFNGTVSGKGFTYQGKVRKENKNIKAIGSLTIQNLKFSLTAKGKFLSIFSFQLERAELSNPTASLTLSGSFSKKSFSLISNIRAEKINLSNFNIQKAKATVSAIGNYTNPDLSLNLTCNNVETPLIKLNRLEVEGKGDRENFSLSIKTEKANAYITYANSRFTGKVSIEKLNLEELKPVARVKKRYGKWIPSINLSFNGNFSYEKGDLNFNGSVTFNRFFFRGFTGNGKGKLSFKRNRLSYMLFLKSGKSLLNSGGEIDIGKKTLKASFNGNHLELSSIDFLKKIGLKGIITGGGELHGKLKNPEGKFRFTAIELEINKGKIGLAEGEVRVENRTLIISAKSEDKAVAIEEIRIGLKKPTPILIRGETRNASISTVLKVLRGYGINLPLEASGTLTGIFEVSSNNVKDKSSFSAHVKIEKGEGKVVLGNKIKILLSNLSGNVDFINNIPEAKLSARLLESCLENLTLSDGKATFELQDRTVELRFSNLTYPKVSWSSITGNLSIGIPEKSIKGRVEVKFQHSLNGFSTKGSLDSKINGNFDSFLIKLNGTLDISSPFLQNTPSFAISGTIEEPSGFGNIELKWQDNNLKLLVFKNRFNLVGTVKQVKFKGENASVNVKLAFVNLDLNTLSGYISIPVFEIEPKGFYRLFSVSGIYVKLQEGTPEISGTRLSYVDGWIEVSKISVENGTVSGKFKAELGAKGLVYLSNVKGVFRFLKGKFKISGSFLRKENRTGYRIYFSSKNLQGKIKYLLEKFEVEKLIGQMENGNLKGFMLEVNVGDGNIVARKNGKVIAISVSEVPIGVIDSWKTLISGNLILTEEKLSGKLNLHRTVFMLSNLKSQERNTQPLKLPLKVEISLNFLESVRISSDLFWFKVIPQLKISGNGKEVKIGGNFFLTEGAINYMGKKFKVVYGTGIIKNLLKTAGSVDILANAYISGYYVYMNIKGKLNSPQLFLTSDPPLTREQILNLIMTGATPTQIEESAEIFPAVQVAYYATASLFKPIEQQFKKAFKLESFNIEPYITKYGETVAKVTLAKRLSKKVRLIGYETTGQNPEYGGSVQVFLTDRYYIETKYNSYYGPEIGVGFELNLR